MKKSIAAILCSSIGLFGCATQQMCEQSKSETTPLSRFEINRAEGTAFDTKTKLTWKICSEGQGYSGGRCMGNATDFTWDNAMQAYDGKEKNWRIPTLDELSSTVEERCQTPAINLAIFTNTGWSDSFWSASSYTFKPADAWFVNFYGGTSSFASKSSSFHVRLVRGDPWVDEVRKQAELASKQKIQLEQAARLAAVQAEKDAYVICDSKTGCDKTFSLTQIYINSNANQKIQIATDTIVETYNPTENGNIGMSAIKIPGKGSSSVVHLTVTCKIDDGGIYDQVCESKKTHIYNGFRPFVSKMLRK